LHRQKNEKKDKVELDNIGRGNRKRKRFMTL